VEKENPCTFYRQTVIKLCIKPVSILFAVFLFALYGDTKVNFQKLMDTEFSNWSTGIISMPCVIKNIETNKDMIIVASSRDQTMRFLLKYLSVFNRRTGRPVSGYTDKDLQISSDINYKNCRPGKAVLLGEFKSIQNDRTSFDLTVYFMDKAAVFKMNKIAEISKEEQKISTLQNFPGHKQASITFAGLKRTFIIYLPVSLSKTKPAPLLIVLHGGGGDGINTIKLTSGGLSTLAEKEKFVVVYPDAVENGWNDGRNANQFRSLRENIDDVGFISALIEEIAKNAKIDPKRIYASGISNGGIMAQRLALDLQEKIAAIAVIAVALPDNFPARYPNPKPVSVLLMPGTNDPTVFWKGGKIGGLFDKNNSGINRGSVLSSDDSVKFWVKAAGCRTQPIITEDPDIDPADGTRVIRELYPNDKGGAEVVRCIILGGGHTWPGGYQYMAENAIGRTSRDIDANKVIWEFFKNHPKK